VRAGLEEGGSILRLSVNRPFSDVDHNDAPCVADCACKYDKLAYVGSLCVLEGGELGPSEYEALEVGSADALERPRTDGDAEVRAGRIAAATSPRLPVMAGRSVSETVLVASLSLLARLPPSDAEPAKPEGRLEESANSIAFVECSKSFELTDSSRIPVKFSVAVEDSSND
jgi:hypothetical protein